MTVQRDWGTFAKQLAWHVDFELLTVLEVDWQQNLVRRCFSTDEANYPSGGVKHLMAGPWADHVIRGGRAFRSQTSDEFRASFADYRKLEALDLFFALNVPWQEWGRTNFTVNLLRGSGAFPEQAVSAVLQRLSSR